MNCPKCSNLMVLAQATNFGEQYQYCRTCKMELAEMQKEILSRPSADTRSPSAPHIQTQSKQDTRLGYTRWMWEIFSMY